MAHLDIQIKQSIDLNVLSKKLLVIDKCSYNLFNTNNFFSTTASMSLLNVDFSTVVKEEITHKISGTVRQMSEPVDRIVRLYKHKDGSLLGETKSDSNGNFEFTVSDGESDYYVMAFDDDTDGKVFNSVVASRIKPVLIT